MMKTIVTLSLALPLPAHCCSQKGVPGPVILRSPQFCGLDFLGERSADTKVRLACLEWLKTTDRSSLTAVVKTTRGWGDRLSIDRNKEDYEENYE